MAKSDLNDLKRMWINQPSSLQKHHVLHGTRVLAIRETSVVYRVWFLDGPIISSQVPALALSAGWPKHLMNSERA